MTFLVPFALGLAAVYVLLHVYLRATQDRREPPVVETTIPFITPAIGLSKNTYVKDLAKRFKNNPIVTLRLPGQRIYVVNDIQLISAIQRQYKNLSFQIVEDGMARLILSITPETQAMVEREAEEWRATSGNALSPGHVQFKAMAPGPLLDNMNQVMLRSMERGMESWIPEGSSSLKTKLFEWVKDAIMVPTTDGVYGPDNPYRDSAVRKAYWTFSDGLPTMTKGGRWFAKAAVAAQVSLGKTFENYFKNGSHEKFIGLGRSIYEYYTERKFPLEEFSQMVGGTSIAVLGNTLPTAFWWVLRLYSDPKVYSACREEILAQVVRTTDQDGTEVRTLDVTALKTSCPLLNSAFKEVLRREAIGSNVRGISEDHMLDGKYLLRKGGLIFFPLASQHFDHDRWGADAEEYCFDRFADKTRPRVANNAFRTFGGGTTLCPGRHFVTTELLAFAAMLLLRFEVLPTSGKWDIPTSLNADMVTSMPPPDHDVDVEIRKRADDKGVKWVWKLSESTHAVMGADQDEHGNDKKA